MALNQAQGRCAAGAERAQQAQANLDLLDTQIEKLTIYAPMDGVILARNVDPGEFVQPGAAAITMADLSELTITVYVPEDRYGEIHLGQNVDVTVDSFPWRRPLQPQFHIFPIRPSSHRAMCKLLQGRSATVYAVKLKVSDPDGKLKLGMPADVVFVK